MTLEQLKAFRAKLIAEKNSDVNDKTGIVTVILYSYDTRDHFDLVVWVRSRENFYYVKDVVMQVALS